MYTQLYHICNFQSNHRKIDEFSFSLPLAENSDLSQNASIPICLLLLSMKCYCVYVLFCQCSSNVSLKLKYYKQLNCRQCQNMKITFTNWYTALTFSSLCIELKTNRQTDKHKQSQSIIMIFTLRTHNWTHIKPLSPTHTTSRTLSQNQRQKHAINESLKTVTIILLKSLWEKMKNKHKHAPKCLHLLLFPKYDSYVRCTRAQRTNAHDFVFCRF